MFFYQYLIIGSLVALSFHQKTSKIAIILLLSLIPYHLFISPLQGEYYYHASAVRELIIFLLLFKLSRSVAIMSLLLIFVNFIGLILYENYHDPDFYNNLCMILILIQVLLLFKRMLPNGFFITTARHVMVFFFNSGGSGAHNKMQNQTSKKEETK